MYNVIGGGISTLQVVNYLSLEGHTALGDTVRAMVTKVGINHLWSSYSLKGKKGKNCLRSLPIYSVFISRFSSLMSVVGW